MKNLILALALVVGLSACTDAEMASFGAYGDEAKVTCWSGGVVVFEDVSTGKVAQLDGDGIVFRSKTSGKYVRLYADCAVLSQ